MTSLADAREQLGAAARRGRSTSSRPRLLLLGNYGNGNTGDEALLAGILPLLSAWDVTVASREPARVQRLHGDVRTVAIPSLAGLRLLLRCDGVAMGGGGVVGPGMVLLPGLLPWVLLLCRLRGARLMLLGGGVYPGAPRITLRLMRWLAARSDVCTVRDEVTRTVLGPAATAGLVDDPAMLLTAAPDAEVDAVLAGLPPGGPLLALAPKATRAPGEDTAMVDTLVAAAAAWRAAGGSVVVVALSDRGDYGRPSTTDASFAAAVAAHLGVDVPVLGPDLPPRVAAGVLGRCGMVAAVRLHAGILAVSQGVPVLQLVFEDKADGFVARYPQVRHVRLGDVDGARAAVAEVLAAA